MHRFSPIPDGGRSKRDVLDQPQDAHPVLGRNRCYATEVLLDDLANHRMSQVLSSARSNAFVNESLTQDTSAGWRRVFSPSRM